MMVNKNGSFRKGYIMSEEIKEKISKKLKGNKNMLGKKHTLETKHKISQKNTGRKHTENEIIKMSNSAKGSYGFWTGKHISDDVKQKISNTLKGHKGNMLGKHQSIDSRMKISKSRIGKYTGIKAGHFGKKHSEISREKIRLKRLLQVFPVKDTSIEVALQNELIKKGIVFEKHKSIIGQPDIFIEPNICVFADGDYWHNLSYNIEKDKNVNKELENRGYIVLRFWEKDINNNISQCINIILEQKMIRNAYIQLVE
ncbi:MAG: NUMOD3 domain-containing DNA-binding protein [Nanoarchaeota archaeon]